MGEIPYVGGRLLEWIDEECAIFTSCQLQTTAIVTKYMSEINFVSPGFQGDILEIGVEMVAIGTTSLTLRCSVRNKFTKNVLINIEKIVFVTLDEEGRPKAHRLAEYAGQKELPDEVID